MTWSHCKNIFNDDNELPTDNHFFFKKKHFVSLQLAQFERVQGDQNHFANLEYMSLADESNEKILIECEVSEYLLSTDKTGRMHFIFGKKSFCAIIDLLYH
jgi:hypothetical protein